MHVDRVKDGAKQVLLGSMIVGEIADGSNLEAHDGASQAFGQHHPETAVRANYHFSMFDGEEAEHRLNDIWNC